MSDPFPLFIALLLLAALLFALFSLLRRRRSGSADAAGMMTEASFLSHAAKVSSDGAAAFAFVSAEAALLPGQFAALDAAEYDALLRQSADALCACLSGSERVAKTGEDTFCFLLKNRSADEIRARLERIAPAFSVVCAEHAEPAVRFGIYLPQRGEIDAAAMLRKAIRARLDCPAESTFRFYDAAWEKQRTARHSTAAAIDDALAHGDLTVFLQPRIRTIDGCTAGAEVLVRWNHPHRGLLTSDMFLPAAEQYGKCGKIDRFVLNEACRFLSLWSDRKRELFPLTVPLSRESAMRPELADECAEICRCRKVEPSLIELSFSEHLLLELGNRAATLIERLHERGFRCAADGFGAGAAPLSLLSSLGLDTVKLDRSFFDGKNDSRGGRCIVESVLKLASQLHIRTVADGVDSTAQAQYLQRAACDMLQGFYYYKPLSPDRFEKEVYDGTQLRCTDRPAAEISREGGASAAQQTSAGSVVLFSYHPKEDHIEFSEPFSPILVGETSFGGAETLLRATELIYDNDREDFFRLLERCQRESGWVESTLRFCLSEGRYGWLEVHMHQELYGDSPVVSGTMINIARWQQEVERWKEKASRDVLTGLYNREHFERAVRTQLEQKVFDSAAAFFIDVDDFKRVNDTMGHPFGDDVLCYVAKQLLGVFRHTDVIARYGGDEFVVFAPSITQSVLEDRLTRLCGAFRFPYRGAAGEYKVSCSIGAAMYQSGDSYAALLEHADCALYEAKLRGKDGFVLYAPHMTDGRDGGSL